MNRAEEIETALTIGINEVLHGDSAESIPLEFKSGWNPISIIHTINAKSYPSTIGAIPISNRPISVHHEVQSELASLSYSVHSLSLRAWNWLREPQSPGNKKRGGVAIRQRRIAPSPFPLRLYRDGDQALRRWAAMKQDDDLKTKILMALSAGPLSRRGIAVSLG